MAWLQCRKGSWRVIFRFDGRQHTHMIGEVKEKEANTVCAKFDYWLMRLQQELVQLPPGCDVVTFIQHDGKPPEKMVSDAATRSELTLSGLRDTYIEAQEHRLEQTTLNGIKLHFQHLTRLFGKSRCISSLQRADIQKYVTSRSKEWIDPNVYRRARQAKQATAKPKRKYKRQHPEPPKNSDKPKRHPSSATIRKEVVSLRTAWNWARRHLGLREEFPGGHLDYAKTEEPLPFMTWDEAERRIEAGDDPEAIWACVYLRAEEIRELIESVRQRPVSPWVYPMFVFAAHTGARRSEMVRALASDLDLETGNITIREKKRDKKRRTTRRVPLSPFLKTVLADWLRVRAKGSTLFCKHAGEPIDPHEAHNYFQRALRTSKWRVLRGWHVFRHSFISALASKGVDQRIIDDMVGHQTEEQRRRYRHLYPDVKEEAIRSVFGDGTVEHKTK